MIYRERKVDKEAVIKYVGSNKERHKASISDQETKVEDIVMKANNNK